MLALQCSHAQLLAVLAIAVLLGPELPQVVLALNALLALLREVDTGISSDLFLTEEDKQRLTLMENNYFLNCGGHSGMQPPRQQSSSSSETKRRWQQ